MKKIFDHIITKYYYYKYKNIVQKQYYDFTGKTLDWNNLETYNEKLQKIKLSTANYRNSRYADKFEVRKFVEQTIGIQHLNSIYGVYDSVDQISFSKLPDQFVIKATHGSGWNIIVKDKKKIDYVDIKTKLSKWLSSNYFYHGYEIQYLKIKPRIIVEKLMLTKKSEIPIDYKFFCHKGIVKYVQLDFDRTNNHQRNIYDSDFNLLPLTLYYPNYQGNTIKPHNLTEMKDICRRLGSDFTHARIDLYDVDNKIIFGEITFTPENGMGIFSPDFYDLEFAKLLL